MNFENLRIVLVGTSHGGNIGAAARAMKTMGLSRLVLVDPEARFPSAEATARAAGADDILYRADVVATLAEAIAPCGLVIGSSARRRHLACPELGPRECAQKIVGFAAHSQVALVFGRERTGLTNTELDFCHEFVMIPANPEFSSLNLASAVQILSYEVRMAALSPVVTPQFDSPPATSAELEKLYHHAEETLIDIGFLHPDRPKHLLRRLRRLGNRVTLESSEVNILRGILAASQRGRGNNDSDS